MADSFGLKIGLEGEKEFKKALADINQSFKVLGSEMKLATSQFDKNDKSVEALAARNKVLRKEIDEQTTKIETLRKALQNEEKLWNYQTAMAMARQMLSQGIITGKEYAKIDATIAKKYGVSSCSIFR